MGGYSGHALYEHNGHREGHPDDDCPARAVERAEKERPRDVMWDDPRKVED